MNPSLPSACAQEQGWTREPLSRKDFDELNKIQIDMDSSEIKKRIRATLYKKFRPKLYFNNFNFELNEDQKAKFKKYHIFIILGSFNI